MASRTFCAFAFLVLGNLLAFAQGPQYTSNSADQTLRSNGRVNPSSLGLEIEIPLTGYKGRGISLPLGLSYSSKQWRLEEFKTVLDQHNYNHTWVFPRYSEDAAAGWTSSLSQPYIEYTGEKYRFNNTDGTQGAPLSLDEIIMPPGPPTAPANLYMLRITVHLPGGSHVLMAQDGPSTVGAPAEGPPAEYVWDTTFYSTDGSGLKYVQTPSAGLYRLFMPDGSFYDFNSTRETKNSTDYLMQIRRANKLTDMNGNYVQFNAPGGLYPNGSWTDQLGRTFPVMIPRETPTLGAGETIKEQEFTLPGMSEPYILRWKLLKGTSQSTSAFWNYSSRETRYSGAYDVWGYTPVNTPALFGGTGPTSTCSGVPQQNIRAADGFYGKFNPLVLTDIVLPNGSSYKFNYNEFGEIDRIYYPAGGHEEIMYDEVPSLAELKDLYKDSNRGVVQRKVYESDEDASGDTWTYSAASSPNNYRTATVAPDGTQTVRFMHRGIPEPSCNQRPPGIYYGTRWGYDNVFAGMQYDERVFSSAGNIVSRKRTRWGATTTTTLLMSPGRYAQRNSRVLSTESITYDGNNGISAITTLGYDTDVDALGSPQNVVRTTEYAFKTVADGNSLLPGEAPANAVVVVADPTPGATAVRVSDVIYLQSDPDYSSVEDEYLERNLLNLATKTLVKNGAGTTVFAQSEIRYDEPSYSNPDQTNAYRGQPTTLRNWLDTTDSWIETLTVFDAYGNVISTTDARGNTTTAAYDSTYHAFPIQLT